MFALSSFSPPPHDRQYAEPTPCVAPQSKTFLDKTWKLIKDEALHFLLDCSPGLGMIALGVVFVPLIPALSIPLLGLGSGMSVTIISLKLLRKFTYLRTQDLNFLSSHPLIHVALLIGTIYLAVMFPLVGFCVAVVMGGVCGLSIEAELTELQRTADTSYGRSKFYSVIDI